MKIPEAEFAFKHSIPLQIRFNDIDMLGHLNNSVYLTFMDLGKAKYFNAVLGRQIEWDDINLAIVNINVNFYAPSYAYDQLECLTEVVAVSQHSLTLEQRIVEVGTGAVKCIARTIMAGFDVKTATSRPIEDKWVEMLEKYEGRKLR